MRLPAVEPVEPAEPVGANADHTVVFTDLYGSTRVFEALGNNEATQRVTHTTSWIATVFQAHRGRVIKKLGDGVLCLFDDKQSALAAVIAMQRDHQARLLNLPQSQQLPIRAGLATGPVELVAGDCYGDAVNVAARLSQLCGPHQILANASSLQGLSPSSDTDFKHLGTLNLRGRLAPCEVFLVEWLDATARNSPEGATRHLVRDAAQSQSSAGVAHGQVLLSWNQSQVSFNTRDKPVHLGRQALLDVVLSSPWVSRAHARLEWRNGCVMLADLSSNGTWVRFEGASADVHLRREECVLHGKGQLSLGTAFADPQATVVNFSLGR